MMGCLFQQTVTGATYMQVVVMLGFAVFIVAPLAYIVIRGWVREIKKMFLNESKERGDLHGR